MVKHSPNIYLASTSPRRSELLSLITHQFEILSIDVPEQLKEGEKPEEYVIRLAIAKATYGLELTNGENPVIGADTIGVFEGQVLEKPKDSQEAINMLSRLSGNTHSVYTGFCILNKKKTVAELVKTEVTFRALSLAEIKEYVATGECFDKAGAYGIQGRAGAFVEKINGSYHNVVGLPIAQLTVHLKAFY